MIENLRMIFLWSLWVLSWGAVLIVVGFILKIVTKLIYLGWNLL